MTNDISEHFTILKFGYTVIPRLLATRHLPRSPRIIEELLLQTFKENNIEEYEELY